MALTDRRIGTQLYGGKAPTKYTVAPGGLTEAQKLAAAAARRQALAAQQAPIQVQAEAGQDWEQLAKATGTEVGDLVKANPLDTDVKAGAVYNVPAQPLSAVTGSELYQQPYYDVAKIPLGMTVKEYNESQVPPTPTPEPRNYIKELLTSGGGREGEQIGETINRLTQPVRDWFLPDEYGQSGGGSADIQTQQQPVSAVTGSQQYQQPYNQMAYRMGGSRAVPQYQYPEGSVNIGGTGGRPEYQAAPTLSPDVTERIGTSPYQSKLPLPQKPSAFEAVNWLTGAGLTGTALLSAGHQLRLDRPEYWDATGGREDVLAGIEKFLIAEFPDGSGGVDWEAAANQDPYIGATLEKLGYHAPPSGFGEDYGDEVSYGGYSYPIPSYGQASGVRRHDWDKQRQAPARLGLVSWSGM